MLDGEIDGVSKEALKRASGHTLPHSVGKSISL